MTSKFDYVAEVQHAALYIDQREAEQKMRKVLRKLVRDAVETDAKQCAALVGITPEMRAVRKRADRIARELVPGSQKRGRK